MKQKDIDTFKDVLSIYEKRSTCARLQVACLLIRDYRIVASGWNGTPPGMKHCYDIFSSKEIYNSKEKALEHHEFAELYEVHAEQACISFSASHGIPTKDCQIFVSISPCSNCAKLLISSGIKEVYYKQEYDRNINGLNLLKENNILCYKI